MASLEAADLFSVKDLVFAITGGGSGLGATMAQTLAANGAAKVYILGRRKEKLEEVAKTGPPGVIIPLPTDITSKDSLQSAAEQIQSETGFLNALIANSGVTGPMSGFSKETQHPVPISELQSTLWKPSVDEFTAAFQPNVAGVYFTLVAFLGLLDKGNNAPESPTTKPGGVKVKSQVVVTTSVAAVSRLTFSGFAYPASKAAAQHLMKIFSTFLLPYGIRCNSIAPGLYQSEMLPDVSTEEGGVDKSLVPLTRAGSAEDIGGAILALCGRGGAYLNGHVYLTDGGRTSSVPATY